MWTGFTPPWSRVGLVLQYLQDRPTPFGEIFKIKRIRTPPNLHIAVCCDTMSQAILWHQCPRFLWPLCDVTVRERPWHSMVRHNVTAVHLFVTQAQLWHITKVNLCYRAELWHATGVSLCHKYKAELWHVTGLDCNRMSQDGSVTYVTCRVLFFRTACDITSRFIGQSGTNMSQDWPTPVTPYHVTELWHNILPVSWLWWVAFSLQWNHKVTGLQPGKISPTV